MCRRSRQYHERQKRFALYSSRVVEDERKRSGWRRERKRSALTRAGHHVCSSIFIYTPTRAWAFPPSPSSFEIWRLSFFSGWARLSSMLVLYGIYRVHNKRMNNLSLKVPIVMGDSWTQHFPRMRVRHIVIFLLREAVYKCLNQFSEI